MQAVIDMLERTQTMIASHRDRIADECNRQAAPLGPTNDNGS
jgi:hypothetical protein